MHSFSSILILFLITDHVGIIYQSNFHRNTLSFLNFKLPRLLPFIVFKCTVLMTELRGEHRANYSLPFTKVYYSHVLSSVGILVKPTLLTNWEPIKDSVLVANWTIIFGGLSLPTLFKMFANKMLTLI